MRVQFGSCGTLKDEADLSPVGSIFDQRPSSVPEEKGLSREDAFIWFRFQRPKNLSFWEATSRILSSYSSISTVSEGQIIVG
jgi:hypothetical protein